MSVDSPKLPSKPQPALLRMIGVLNLLFGMVLLLCGGLCLNTVTSALAQNTPLRLDPVMTRDVLEQMRKQMVKDLQDEMEVAGKAERERLQQRITDLESKPTDLTGKIDFDAINHDLPTLARYLWAETVSGPILNLAMVIAGLGLILLQRWGRVLGIAVAALKIIRLVALNAVFAFVVVPQMSNALDQFARTEVGGAFIKHAMEQQNAQSGNAGTAPQLSAGDFVQIMRALGYGYAVTLLALGVIYPVVSIIILTRPSARAACRRVEPEEDVPLVPPRVPPAGPAS